MTMVIEQTTRCAYQGCDAVIPVIGGRVRRGASSWCDKHRSHCLAQAQMRYITRKRAGEQPKPCAYKDCGKSFQPRGNQRYCSVRCAKLGGVDYRRKYDAWRNSHGKTPKPKAVYSNGVGAWRAALLDHVGLGKVPKGDWLTRSELLHMPPDRAIAAINAILSGERGLV